MLYLTYSDEVLKVVLPSEDGYSEEKKPEQNDGVVEQYKKIIREQVSYGWFFPVCISRDFDQFLRVNLIEDFLFLRRNTKILELVLIGDHETLM